MTVSVRTVRGGTGLLKALNSRHCDDSSWRGSRSEKSGWALDAQSRSWRSGAPGSLLRIRGLRLQRMGSRTQQVSLRCWVLRPREASTVQTAPERFPTSSIHSEQHRDPRRLSPSMVASFQNRLKRAGCCRLSGMTAEFKAGSTLRLSAVSGSAPIPPQAGRTAVLQLHPSQSGPMSRKTGSDGSRL